MTSDPLLAHTPGWVIWHRPSQTAREGVSSHGYNLSSVVCPLRVGNHPPLTAAPSTHVFEETEDATERQKQLPRWDRTDGNDGKMSALEYFKIYTAP